MDFYLTPQLSKTVEPLVYIKGRVAWASAYGGFKDLRSQLVTKQLTNFGSPTFTFRKGGVFYSLLIAVMNLGSGYV